MAPKSSEPRAQLFLGVSSSFGEAAEPWRCPQSPRSAEFAIRRCYAESALVPQPWVAAGRRLHPKPGQAGWLDGNMVRPLRRVRQQSARRQLKLLAARCESPLHRVLGPWIHG